MAMKKKLEDAGFEVTLLKDCTLKELRHGIRNVVETLTDDDLFLFYYSGHGEEGPNGSNYIIPIDATNRARLDDDAYDLNDLFKRLNRDVEGAHSMNIIILDCCRMSIDNDVWKSADPKTKEAFPQSNGFKQGHGSFPNGKGFILWFGCAPGTVARDGPPEGHSIFTEGVLQFIGCKQPLQRIMMLTQQWMENATQATQKTWWSCGGVHEEIFLTEKSWRRGLEAIDL